MAENPKAACSTADNSETIPLMAEGFDNEISDDVQPSRSSITESDKGCVRTEVVPAVEGDAGVEAAADGDDQKELIGEVGLEGIELGVAEQDPRRSPRLAYLCLNAVEEAINQARAAARTCTIAAESSQNRIRATNEALDVGNKRKNKAHRKSLAVANSDEANHYSHLESVYDDAIKKATKRVSQMEAAAESAENAAKEAEDAAEKMDEAFREASNEAEQRMRDLHSATLAANAAAIMVYKLEYCAVKAMKSCCKDLEPYVGGTRNQTRCMEERQKKILEYALSTVAFVFGVIVLAGSLSYLNKSGKESYVSLIFVGSILVTFPSLYLLFKSIIWCKSKVIEARRKKRASKMEKIDESLQELQQYFEENNISPVPSDFEDQNEE